MTDSTTSAAVCPRLAAPAGTCRRGPGHSALFPFGPHRLASTIRRQPTTLTAEPII